MILVYSNNSDITADVAKNSVKINEQLNNRRNTLSFKTLPLIRHSIFLSPTNTVKILFIPQRTTPSTTYNAPLYSSPASWHNCI